ncbi:uncharacterized protein LOC135199561 [Macrobrachium nipponense]|uniref:uncharacterized protein LOC135199561 n=1 Tax=Macrobrachium nipponense TaxID=159736 RepID=UPI0030C7FD81
METINLRCTWMVHLPLLWIPLIMWSGITTVTDCQETWLATGYILKDQPAYSTTMWTPSNLVCALHARRSMSSKFVYANETCDLYESVSETSGPTMKFAKSISANLLEEIARGKNTFASTQYSYYAKGLAVDGNISTSYYSLYLVQYPFLMVDLGEVRTVYLVKILPVNDGDFNNIEVRLGMDLLTTGDFSSYTLLARYAGPYLSAQQYLSIYSPGVPGRYLSIQKVPPGDNLIWIIEVEVYALKKP